MMAYAGYVPNALGMSGLLMSLKNQWIPVLQFVLNLNMAHVHTVSQENLNTEGKHVSSITLSYARNLYEMVMVAVLVAKMEIDVNFFIPFCVRIQLSIANTLITSVLMFTLEVL